MKKQNQKQIENLIENSNKLIGLRQVTKNLLEGTIKCVIVSIDSEDFIFDIVKEKASLQNIEVLRELKSQEIGRLCKISVPCSVVGILS